MSGFQHKGNAMRKADTKFRFWILEARRPVVAPAEAPDPAAVVRGENTLQDCAEYAAWYETHRWAYVAWDSDTRVFHSLPDGNTLTAPIPAAAGDGEAETIIAADGDDDDDDE